MTTHEQDGRRALAVHAATALARSALAAAGASPAGSPAQRFFHGVETAAQHVVHPETATVRDGTAWLEAEDPSFRDGFLQASTRLAMAAAAPTPPTHIGLPEPTQ